MDLAGGAVPGRDPAGDLAQVNRLPLARSFADVQRDRGVGQVVLVLPAPVIGAGDGGERVGEQGRGPAAPVKVHRHPAAFAHDLPQLREQSAQFAGERLRRLGDDHEHRVAVLAGDPGLLGGRGGELRPRDVHLLKFLVPW